MQKIFTKPLAHFIPLAEVVEAPQLTTMSEDELSVVLHRSKEAVAQQVFRQNPDLIERQIGDEWMLVPTGNLAQQFNGMISLNEYSYYVWHLLEEPKSLSQVLQLAQEDFIDEHHMLDIQIRDIFNRFIRLGLFLAVQS